MIDTNLKGRRVSSKIVAIESDDWGSIRVPSYKTIEALKSKGINLEEYAYTKYDGLENDDDIECLLDIICSVKDKHGNHPIITANFVTCNPDFKAIKSSEFKQYHYELISETFKRYSNSSKVLSLIKEGYLKRIILPQFHGREHVNSEKWLKCLRNNDKRFLLAFENNMFGLGRNIVPDLNFNIQATYDTTNDDFALEGLYDGLQKFYEIFSFHSSSFIANNFIWNDTWHKKLKDLGISHFQGMKYQILPLKDGDNTRRRIRRFNGQINEYNQVFTTRNCEFEPSVTGYGYEKTMKDIEIAFRLNQPAIISTHRINFTSRICSNKRDENLKIFNELLKNILKKWPDVIFMSSIELSNLYNNNKNK